MIKRCITMACLLAGLSVAMAAPGLANDWRSHGGGEGRWHGQAWGEHGRGDHGRGDYGRGDHGWGGHESRDHGWREHSFR